MNESPILEARGLRAGYEEVEVLHGLDFLAGAGEFLGIAGPNGAGKSTLLRALAGLLAPTGGSVLLEGRPLASYSRRVVAKKIAVIHQEFSCSYDFTVFDIVAMGRSPHLHRWKPLSKEDISVIHRAMEMTEVAGMRGRLFLELSGGEQQRVVVAKALAQEPAILLLDEPSTHLDLHHQVAVYEILSRLNREQQVTILCITHDLTLGSQYIRRYLLLKDGLLIGEGTPAEIMKQDLMEELFQTAVSVGVIEQTQTPYLYPIRLDK